jgi:hypothetical protein
MNLPNQRTKIEWTSYLATAYTEGFCEGEDGSPEEVMEAWAYLIMTGQCWSLQGWFGRTANTLIESGYIDKQGNIDWDLANSKV